MNCIKFIAFTLLLYAPHVNAIELQKASNWCWVASVQDVIAQAGIYQNQETIAIKLIGWPQNKPAFIHEVVALVNSYGLKAWQAGYPGSPQELHNTLTSGWKIIAFVKPLDGPVGHYIVLQGVDLYGNVIASDPANGITATYTPYQLYHSWKWGDSVIVGK